MKEKYRELQKHFELPKFEEIDTEFEISSIEHETFLVREIRRKMHDKIDFVVEVLDGLLQPDPTSLFSMTEYHFFSDSEREEISKLFKDLMMLKRKAEKSSLGNDEDQALYINEAFKKWMGRKPEIEKIFSKMTESWPKEEKIKPDLDYMT